MKHDKLKIDNLKKVAISLEAGTAPDSMNLTPKPFRFEFIFGLGKEGLSPFECELADKVQGDEILLHLNREELHKTFEHLSPRLPRFSDAPDAFCLKVQIVEVVPAESREVIKAMAEASACGAHCCGDSCCHF